MVTWSVGRCEDRRSVLWLFVCWMGGALTTQPTRAVTLLLRVYVFMWSKPVMKWHLSMSVLPFIL